MAAHLAEYLKSLNPDHYCLVRESQKHLHYHVLLFFDDLPSAYKCDPNGGRPGTRREMVCFFMD